MNRIVLSIWLAFVFAGLASAQSPSLPLYDAFQTFCVKTDGSPDAVEKAVKQAGGVPHVATPAEQQFPLLKGQTRSQWDVSVSGRALTVLAKYDAKGMVMLPNPTTSCMLMSNANEDGSIAALTNWVAVPPAQDLATLGKIYQYEQQGDHRTAMLMDQHDREAAIKILNVMAEGRYWTLMVMGGTDRASVILLHVLAKPASAVSR